LTDFTKFNSPLSAYLFQTGMLRCFLFLQQYQSMPELDKANNDLIPLIQRTIDEALNQGASAVEADAGSGTGLVVTVRERT
jgi:hypothetical protein